MSISAAILLVFSSLMAMPQGAKEDRSREMERRRRWQRLSQEDQSRLVDRLRRWKSLPLEKRNSVIRSVVLTSYSIQLLAHAAAGIGSIGELTG